MFRIDALREIRGLKEAPNIEDVGRESDASDASLHAYLF